MNILNQQKIRAFTLLETIMVLGILSSVAILETKYYTAKLEQTAAINLGQQLAIYNNGIRAYLAEDINKVLAAHDVDPNVTIGINELKHSSCSQPGLSTKTHFVPCSFDANNNFGIQYSTRFEVVESNPGEKEVSAITQLAPLKKGGRQRTDLAGLAALSALGYSIGGTSAAVSTFSNIRSNPNDGSITMVAISSVVNDPWLRIDGGNNMEAAITFLEDGQTTQHGPIMTPSMREIRGVSRIYDKYIDAGGNHIGRDISLGDKSLNSHIISNVDFEVAAYDGIDIDVNDSAGIGNANFTVSAQNTISFESGHDILFKSNNADIEMYSKQNTNIISNTNSTIESNSDTIYTALNNLNIDSDLNTHFNADAALFYDADQGISFHSDNNNIEFKSDKIAKLEADNIDSLASNGIHFNALNGGFNAQSTQGDIHLESINGQEDSITMEAQNTAHINATTQLNVNAQKQLYTIGQTGYTISANTIDIKSSDDLITESNSYILHPTNSIDMSANQEIKFESTHGNIDLKAPAHITTEAQIIDGLFTQDISLHTGVGVNNFASGILDIESENGLVYLKANTNVNIGGNGQAKYWVDNGYVDYGISIVGVDDIDESGNNIHRESISLNQYNAHNGLMQISAQNLNINSDDGSGFDGTINIESINSSIDFNINAYNPIGDTQGPEGFHTAGKTTLYALNDLDIFGKSSVHMVGPVGIYAGKYVDTDTGIEYITQETRINTSNEYEGFNTADLLYNADFETIDALSVGFYSASGLGGLYHKNSAGSSSTLNIKAPIAKMNSAGPITIEPFNGKSNFSASNNINISSDRVLTIDNAGTPTKPATAPGDIIFTLDDDFSLYYNSLTAHTADGDFKFISEAEINLTSTGSGTSYHADGAGKIQAQQGDVNLSGNYIKIESEQGVDVNADKILLSQQGPLLNQAEQWNFDSNAFNLKGNNITLDGKFMHYYGNKVDFKSPRLFFGLTSEQIRNIYVGSNQQHNIINAKNVEITGYTNFIDRDGFGSADPTTPDGDLLLKEGIDANYAVENTYKRVANMYAEAKYLLKKSNALKDGINSAHDGIDAGYQNIRDAADNKEEFDNYRAK